MSTKWILLKTIQREPENRLACFALADLLEEENWLDLSFCYRWMGWYDRRPGPREGKRLRKRFVWYREGADLEFTTEKERFDSLRMAHLEPLVYALLKTKNLDYQLYSTWEKAVNDLARGLARIREMLVPPTEG